MQNNSSYFECKIVKVTKDNKIVELELLYGDRCGNNKNLAKFIIDTSNGNCIKKSCIEIK